MRAWFAIAVLAGSWLLGLGYFQPASPFSWLCLVAVGVVLLSEIPLRLPERGLAIATVPLVVPSMFLAPLPYKVIPILFGVGILLCRTPIPRRWPRRTGRGMIVAGAILFAQSAILWCYQLLTARRHELPWPLATLPHLAARLMGADAARDGASVAFRSSLSPLRIAATWELLFDPATVCFVVGGLALLLIKACASSRSVETRSILRSSLILLGITLVWSLLRMAFLIALVLHMVLRADPVTYPNVGELLVSTWLHLALLGPLALLSALLVPDFVRLNNRRQRSESSPTVAQLAGPLALVTAGVAVLVWLYTFEPVGSPKGGRICVMERHSTWEPTTEPYRTKVYGEAGSYNYAATYEYCGQYYEMAQLLESNSIDDAHVVGLRRADHQDTHSSILGG